jgi:quinol monooxygenase YgiN
MNAVHLTGLLVCKTADEAKIVARHLPQHVELTRAEPGCLSFDVTPTSNPMVWAVNERFADEPAFNLHQQRAAGSDWGQATVDIERQYSVHTLPQ